MTEPTDDQIKDGRNSDGASALAGMMELPMSETIITVDLIPYQANTVYFLAENEDGDRITQKVNIVNKLDLIKAQAASSPNLLSLLVNQADEKVMEEYYNGFTASTATNVKSVSKGITSIIVGKAIELGYFNLDSKLGDFLPDKYLVGLSEVKKDITVRHFLTMSSGLGGLESEFSQWIQTPDEVVAILERDMVSPPGTTFAYSTPNLQMLSVMFQEATGKTLHQFSEEYFFVPMGISDSRWPPFETGYTGPILFLKTSDMLKIGQMVSQGGMFNGTRMMEESYLNEMVDGHVNVPTNGANSPKITSNKFGYLWWELNRGSVNGFTTAGYAGQFIAVFPSLDLVIAINSKPNVNLQTAVTQHQNATSLIADIVDALK
jgi:CubicO group peptidase (beta-lactamase class C family)